MGSGSNDPAVRFFDQMISDALGPAAGQRRAQGGGHGHDSNGRDVFIPISPVPAAVTVIGVEADPITSWMTGTLGTFPATAQLVSVVDQIAAWSTLAAAATGAAVIFDAMRWCSRRHRLAVSNQLAATTGITPRSVRVLPPPGVIAPRRMVLKVPIGSVIPDNRYAAFGDALTKYANRSRLGRREWVMHVDWQAGSSRLVIERRDAAANTGVFSDQHQRLSAMLDEKFPLPNARISAVEHDADGAEIGYTISYTTSLVAALPGLQQKLREALVGSLPHHPSERDWTVAVHAESDTIVIGLAEPLPSMVAHRPLDDYTALGRKEIHKIPFATGAGSAHAFWNIATSSSGPHILLAGKTGGGKTSTIRTLLTEAIPRGVPVAAAIDPKMIELDGFETYPGVCTVAYHVRDIVAVINAVHAEMMARSRFIHDHKVPPTDMPLFIVVMDEFFVMGGFLRRAQGYKGDDDAQAELAAFVKNSDPFGKIGEILALIRSSGGRIVMGIQRPDAKNFGADAGSVRDNFGTRVSHSNLSMDGAMMMWDDAHVGRDLDTSIPGRATVADEQGTPMPAQIHWTPDVDDHPNKQARLGADDRAVVDALHEAARYGRSVQNFVPEIVAELERIDGAVPTPGDGPIMACFSSEMRQFIRERQNVVPQAPASIDGLDPVAMGDEGVAASALTPGTRIHVDDNGRSVVAAVVAVMAGKKAVRVKLRDEANPRITLAVEYEPDEIVLTADPVDDSADLVSQ